MPEESAANPEAAAAKPLSFEVEESGETAVVKCKGRLVAGTCEAFTAEMKPLLASKKKLVIDLADLTYVDSMGWVRWCGLRVVEEQRLRVQAAEPGQAGRNVIRLTEPSVGAWGSRGMEFRWPDRSGT